MGRWEFGRDIGLAGGAGLLVLLLGGLSLLLLLLALPAGPQQVLEGVFELAEGIGSYCSEWLANATNAVSE